MTKRSHLSLVRSFGSDQRGGIAMMAGLAITGVALTAAFVMVKGEAYNAQQKLQMSANMAALAGASQISGGATGAATAADQVSAANTVMGQQPTMVAGYPKAVCLTSVGIPCTNGSNAVQVKQQATVSLFMGGLFGQDTATVTATATAIESGGTGTTADIMIIVDTTASMNGSDSTCSISGATRIGCALAGARSLLTAFKPSQANVGLMAFPGVQNTTEAAKDYACPGSNPTTVAYSASPNYLIVPLSSDYKSSDTATSLNSSSNLVKAIGGASGCGSLKAVGGFGTYYADAISAAQTALTSTGRANAQKVIIFLSDGDSNASSANVGSAKASNQCAAGRGQRRLRR
jgi:Flp pilus assembly protein TadG